MRNKKTGNVRMKQLGRVKVELWLSADQAAMLERVARELGLAKATFARRAVNYMVRGGVGTCQPLQAGYD